MNFIDPALENYCVNQSMGPSTLCEELAEYTRENVAMSIMLSGRLVGGTLGFLIRAIGAKVVVEVGCYTGYSALAMAEALPDDGQVVSYDVNPDTLAIARTFWSRSPHGTKITACLGDAKITLESMKSPIDFAFIDADKVGYETYFGLLWPRLRSGGILAADNCLYDGQVLLKNPPEKNAVAIDAYNKMVAARKDADSLLLPIRDGVMLARKK